MWSIAMQWEKSRLNIFACVRDHSFLPYPPVLIPNLLYENTDLS